MPYQVLVLTTRWALLETDPCTLMGLLESATFIKRLRYLVKLLEDLLRRATPCRQIRGRALAGKSCQCQPARKLDQGALQETRLILRGKLAGPLTLALPSQHKAG